MTTEVDICNGALGFLGQGQITSLTDGDTKASTCAQRYPVARDSVLQMHPWNFAIKRAQRSADTAAPVYGFANAFSLPADCLQVLDLEDAGLGEDWRVENGKILADLGSPLRFRYIARITDPVRFSPLFRDALELYLASQMATALTDSQSRRENLLREFRALLSEARSTDAQEGYPQNIDGSHWLQVR